MLTIDDDQSDCQAFHEGPLPSPRSQERGLVAAATLVGLARLVPTTNLRFIHVPPSVSRSPSPPPGLPPETGVAGSRCGWTWEGLERPLAERHGSLHGWPHSVPRLEGFPGRRFSPERSKTLQLQSPFGVLLDASARKAGSGAGVVLSTKRPSAQTVPAHGHRRAVARLAMHAQCPSIRRRPGRT